MRRIDAVVRPEQLGACLAALDAACIKGVTVYEARGHGVQGGLDSTWNGVSRRVALLPKASLAVVVNDHECQTAVEALMSAARTGHAGDGKIFVSTIDNAIRVRTGEEDFGAI